MTFSPPSFQDTIHATLLACLIALLTGCASSHDFASGRTFSDGARPGYTEKERAPGVYFIEAHGPVRIFGTIAARNTWSERASQLCAGKKYEEFMISEYEYLDNRFPVQVKRGYCLCEGAAVSDEELKKIRQGLL
jgi:hypothetical protein